MDYRRTCFILVTLVLIFFGSVAQALANKASVTIDALNEAQKGSEIAIRINVSHDGNSFIHFVDWVYVNVNGKEVARWQFSSSNRPEAGNFSRELKVVAEGTLDIISEAHCSIHGSAGPAKLTLKPN